MTQHYILIAYPGYHDRKEPRARARLRVYEEYSRRRRGQTARLVVVYSEPLGEYTGLSPTNGAERVATVAIAKLGVNPANVTFVEYYPPNDVRDEMFDFVRFSWIQGCALWWIASMGKPPSQFAVRADWRLSSRERIETEIIGEVFK